MANLDTFCCASCGREFVVRPGEDAPACPACGAILHPPAARPAARTSAAPGSTKTAASESFTKQRAS